MKPLIFKRSSYAFRFATVYSQLDEWVESIDICTYWKYVAKGVFLWLVVTTLACIFISLPFGSLLGWAAACISTGILIGPEGLAAAAVGSIAVSLVLALGVWITFHLMGYFDKVAARRHRKKYSTVPPAQPSFLVSAWRSFKEKTCVPVEFTE